MSMLSEQGRELVKDKTSACIARLVGFTYGFGHRDYLRLGEYVEGLTNEMEGFFKAFTEDFMSESGSYVIPQGSECRRRLAKWSKAGAGCVVAAMVDRKVSDWELSRYMEHFPGMIRAALEVLVAELVSDADNFVAEEAVSESSVGD